MDNEIILTDSPTEQQVDEHKYLKKVFFRVGIGFLLLNIVTGVAQTAIFELIASLSHSLLHDPFVYNAVSMLPIYLFGFPVLCMFTAKLPRARAEKTALTLSSVVTIICISFAAMSVGNQISRIIRGVFDTLRDTPMQNPITNMTSGASLVTNILFLSVLAPIFEELMFRKYLCSRLLPFGETVAIVASAAIFGLVHGNFFQLFYAFLMGLVLGYTYVKHGNILFNIAIHALINLVFGSIPTLISDKLILFLENQTLDALLLALPFIAIALLHSYYTSAFSVCGIAFLAMNRKKIRFAPLPAPLETRPALKAMLCNVGVILFFIYIICQYLLRIFS